MTNVPFYTTGQEEFRLSHNAIRDFHLKSREQNDFEAVRLAADRMERAAIEFRLAQGAERAVAREVAIAALRRSGLSGHVIKSIRHGFRFLAEGVVVLVRNGNNSAKPLLTASPMLIGRRINTKNRIGPNSEVLMEFQYHATDEGRFQHAVPDCQWQDLSSGIFHIHGSEYVDPFLT